MNKVLWEFGGDLDSREAIRKDSQKEARDRYLINAITRLSIFTGFQKIGVLTGGLVEVQ